MDPDAMAEVLSSRIRLRIADAISSRPRTLGELSTITEISIQGVLRHLKLLMELGLVEEKKLVPRTPKARRVYMAKSEKLGDYSTEDLTIVKVTEIRRPHPSGQVKTQELERMAGELLIQRRRIRDESRRLGRMIDELVSQQQVMSAVLDEAHLVDSERLILEVLLTEETAEEGAKVLSRHYGLDDRRSIEGALTKAKRIVDK